MTFCPQSLLCIFQFLRRKGTFVTFLLQVDNEDHTCCQPSTSFVKHVVMLQFRKDGRYCEEEMLIPVEDLTFDDYVQVETDIAVWGTLSDAEILVLDHNNTGSVEDESDELTPITLTEA
ncbi:hypothetical protein TNCV_4754291 [Trichonephila clavipes]|nr:hypothetical protein TNCV_4754291 [Trichonephila clavipes]